MRAPVLTSLMILVIATSSCKGEEDPPAAVECVVVAPTECTDPELRYADVQPIFQQRCVEGCHNGMPNGPWPLTDYDHIADWWDVVRDEVKSCAMPPPDSGRTMTNEERDAILLWIRCGFPE
jgi:hypothetical protein